MQENWAVLFLLVVAVVVFALVKSRQKPEDAEGADEQSAESAGTPDSGRMPGAAPEPESSEVSWEDCQRQLEEEPPLEACDRVEFPQEETDFNPNLEPETEAVPPESPHEANCAIRREAWRLFKANFLKILPLSGLIVALNVIPKFIPSDSATVALNVFLHIIPTSVIIRAVLIRVLIVISWLITLGAYRAAVQVFKGDALRPGTLGYFLKGRRFFPALGLYLLQSAVLLLPAAMSLGFMQLVASNGFDLKGFDYFLFVLEMLIFQAFQIWLWVYTKTSCFAMAHSPDRGAIAAFKAGFQLGHRNFGQILSMMATAGWPFGVVIALEISEFYISNQKLSLAIDLLNNLLILFYSGYFVLSMAGLVNRLLESADCGTSEGEASQISPDGKNLESDGIEQNDRADCED